MKSPPIALEIRWRIAGEEDWSVRRYPIGIPVVMRDLDREEEYEIEARHVGHNELASEWVPASFTVPGTHRTGVAGLPVTSVGNAPSRWVEGTIITWSATDTEATINVSAGLLQVAEQQIAYAASVLELDDGTPEEVRNLWLYYDDALLAGGARTLGATTSAVTAMAEDGRLLIGPVQIIFDSVGGGGTGGSGDIGGGGGGSGGGPPTPFPVIDP